MAESGRILAIDYGEKRIGLAISDPFAIISSGVGTFVNDEQFWKTLTDLVREQVVIRIIVGLPLTMSGQEGDSVAMVRKFVDKLKTKTDVPVELVDERLTSVMATNTIRELGVGKKKREKNKGKIDELAAVHLLQGYLQSSSRGF